MLAKAYSIVRGSREKEEAPLDEFFKIAAPLIAVIPPEVSSHEKNPSQDPLSISRRKTRTDQYSRSINNVWGGSSVRRGLMTKRRCLCEFHFFRSYVMQS
jgi:hypothetical protein